jgi:hypothetical protein
MGAYDLITQSIVFLHRRREGKQADTYTIQPVMGSFDRQTTSTVGADGRVTINERVRICVPTAQDKWHAFTEFSEGDYAYLGTGARGLGLSAEQAIESVKKNNGVKITHVRRLDYDAVGSQGLGKYGSIYYCEGE